MAKLSIDVQLVGLGLIGGSLGLALRDSPLVGRIMVTDRTEECLEKAVEIGAGDEIVSLREGASRAGLIFLCSPPGSFASIVAEIGPVLRPGTIVTDVGSTKLAVMEVLSDLPAGVWKIGGHPMAGAETRGIGGADRYLFENAMYILCPAEGTAKEVVGLLATILASTGARIQVMAAAVHDRLVAAISHLPHLAAASLVNLAGRDPAQLMLAAGGFRDTTRIASSNPELWEDILFSNRGPLLGMLESYLQELNHLKKALETEDRRAVNQILSSAKGIRDSIPGRQRGLVPGFADLVCIVPDQPGIIGRLGAILGAEGINIVDIEILRVREGDGGTIRLGVPTLVDAERAVTILQSHAIKAWVK